MRLRSDVRGAAIVLAAMSALGCGSGAALSPDGSAEKGGAGAGAGAAGSDAGAAGAAGAPTCGGDLVGTWAVSQVDLTPDAPGSSVNACLDLVLDRYGGTLGASTWTPSFGPERDIAIVFMSSGLFEVEDSRRGLVTLRYAASCLASPAGPPSCDELAVAVAAYGQGNGELQSATCASAPSGGCDCTLDLSVVQGARGTWSSSGGVVTFVNAFSLEQTPSSYCIDGAGLRFDPSVEAVLPGGSRLVFGRVDCEDGEQGPGEQGIDCGWACPIGCPRP